ncbi:MAG: type IV secretion system DNA-binding domain-containing protein [Candidatus Buchananbacteria bacterium]|nr:type IV secretion system DNA-binding domain-containing protein [Candidatus Buchananbacteria bacterium]
MGNFSIQLGESIVLGPEALIIGGLVLFFIILALVVLYWLSQKITRRIYKNLTSFKQTVLLVMVPKYEVSESGEKTGQPKSQQELAERVAIMETFFANLAGLKAQKGFKSSFLGRTDHISFEIVLRDGLIYFYVVVPETLRDFIEEQITAQFPKAVVEEVEDYNIFNPKGTVLGSMLKFKKEYIYPIKTYKKLEADSLNSLTNTLSKLDENSGAAIQVIVRSATPAWHKWGQQAASAAYQGKKISQAVSESSQGFSLKKISNFFQDWVGTGEKKNEKQEPEKPYQLSEMEREIVKGIEEKAAKGGLDVNIRIVVSADNESKAKSYLENILNSFSQFNIYEYGNAFARYSLKKEKLISDFIFREFNEKAKMIMNTEEITSVYHFPLGHTETPNIVWLQAQNAAAPTNVPVEGLYLGDNFYRGQKTPIRIKKEDRRRHMYIIGMTGTGKSKWMDMLAIQDIHNGEGMCYIDPHGDDVDFILSCVPKERAEDVVVFDPSDFERPLALNMLEYNPAHPEQKIFAVNEMLAIFDKLYDLKATGGPMFEQYMRNALLLIMDDPESGSTLLEISKVLADEEFRNYKLSKCKTPVVKDFWEKEAQKAGGEAALANIVPYITSKLTPFIANDLMRPIVSQQKSSLNFREAMDQQKIILVKLAKGKIGDINANLLGMIIIGKILMAALGRSDTPESQRKDFYLYIDEFQNFLTESINVILAEARKYRLCLTIAHQFLGQLVLTGGDEKTKKAIFGNVGTKACFRIGVEDAEEMAKEFAPVFNSYDLVNNPAFNAFMKLMIDNANPPAFNIKIPWVGDLYQSNEELKKAIIELSRLKYGRDRNVVEAEVMERSQMGTSRNIIKEAKQTEDESDEDMFF